MRAVAARGGVAFAGELAPGQVAYVDGGIASPGPVDALVVVAGSELDDAAGSLAALAGPVREALGGASTDVEVLGDGAVARLVRRLSDAPRPETAPRVVVDLTGDPEAIRGALARLADLGTLLLARDPSVPLDLDLYPDVHVRGLRVVGVPRPSAERRPAVVAGDVPAPVEATLGEPVAEGAAWYRVSPAAA
jgi:hypothetical protein